MRAGLAISFIGHAAILGWGMIVLPSPRAIEAPAIEVLPIELINLDEVTSLQKGSPTAEPEPVPPAPEKAEEVAEAAPEPPPPPEPEPAPPEPEPAPPEPEPEPAPPEPEPAPPEPEPAPAAEVAPEPEPEPAPAPVTKPEPPKVASAPAPVPKPRSKPRPTGPAPDDQSAFNPDRIAALLDRSAEPPAASTPSDQTASLGARTGKEGVVGLTQSEIDSLRARMVQCWSPPRGATSAAEVRTVVIIRLSLDGSVVGNPEVVERPFGRYADIAPQSVVRAILTCAPYNLPLEKYDTWREIKMTFDPVEMF